MSTKLVIKDVVGNIINIGPWDYQIDAATGTTLNPLPAGAYESTADVITGSDGGKYATENYKALRIVEYPPIGDQLDALFKAGVFPPEMAIQLQAIKDKYPKP